jgi:hypothetical protein
VRDGKVTIMTFTPTTEQVRDAYVRALRNAFIASAGEHEAEFKAWLTEQLTKAWEQGVSDALGKPWLDVPGRDSGFHRYSAAHIGALPAAS